MSGMKMDEREARLWQPVTEQFTGRAFKVAKALGHGFLEKSPKWLAHQMRKSGLGVVVSGETWSIPTT
jgi:hypothetical protein